MPDSNATGIEPVAPILSEIWPSEVSIFSLKEVPQKPSRGCEVIFQITHISSSRHFQGLILVAIRLSGVLHPMPPKISRLVEVGF